MTVNMACVALLLLLLVAVGQAELNFLSVGDWGVVNEHQAAVAQQMGVYADQYDAEFVVALGDNFYDNGVASTDDEQWQTTFDDVFTADSLQVPWYALLGNHDYRGSAQAQIDYYLDGVDDRWVMPDQFYTQVFGDGLLRLVVIDTVIIAPGEDDEVIISEEQLARFDEQLEWLDQTLAENSLVSLDGSASSDPDSDALTYSWTQVAGPAVALTGASTSTPSFTAPFVSPGGADVELELIGGEFDFQLFHHTFGLL